MTPDRPKPDATVAPPGDEPTIEETVGDLSVVRRVSGAGRPSPASVRHLYRRIATGLVVTDCVSIVAAVTLAGVVRGASNAFTGGFLIGMAVAPVVWVAAFGAFGLYAMQGLSGPERIRRTMGATSAGLFLVAFVMSLVDRSFSGRELAILWAMTLGLFFVTRGQWHRYEQHLRERGRLSLRTVIVGTNAEARRLGEHLKTDAWGFEPVGCVSPQGRAVADGPLPYLGPLDRLPDVIAAVAADCVIVAVTAVQADDIRRVLAITRKAGIEVKVSAGLPMMLTSRVSVQNLGGAMAFAIRPVRLRRTQALVKRVFDVVGATMLLLLTAPLLALVAVAVRVTSPGSILFRQERITKGLRTFTVYKFRTMRTDGDDLLPANDVDRTAAFFKLVDDPRITRVGRVIRALSIDELPQLWNVLRGEMSLVGPRPLPLDQVASNVGLLEARHEVAAGLTGWWQVNGRSSVTPDEAVRLDLFYIENWSLPLDLYILVRSFGAVLTRRGAH